MARKSIIIKAKVLRFGSKIFLSRLEFLKSSVKVESPYLKMCSHLGRRQTKRSDYGDVSLAEASRYGDSTVIRHKV